MAEQSLYEKGDSLEALAIKARQWFIKNNVKVPEGAAKWQKCSVRRGEVPPGTAVGALRRYGFNVTAFIACITMDSSKKPYNYDPLTPAKLEIMGLSQVSESWKNAHKYLTVRCTKCLREEELTYGKLQEAKQRGDKYCRYCRNVGGKKKDIDVYDIYDGFTPISCEDTRVKYSCHSCSQIIERTLTHVNTAEYLVCEICYPKFNFGARHYTELGYFDSKIEYEAYKILLSLLSPELIIRQKKYDELFGTGTKHTADFYLPSLNLVLEVTSKYNKIGEKYKETAKWKLSLSTKVKFAYSLSEVEDIVRSAMKVAETTVANW